MCSLLFCVHLHPDSGPDADDYSDDGDGDGDDVDVCGGSVGDEERRPATNSEDRVVGFSASAGRTTESTLLI